LWKFGYYGHLGYASLSGTPGVYLTIKAHAAFLNCVPTYIPSYNVGWLKRHTGTPVKISE